MRSPFLACIKHKFILRLFIVVLLVSSLWLIGNQHSSNQPSTTEHINVSVNSELQGGVVNYNNNLGHLLKSDIDVRGLIYRKRQPVLIKPDCESVARSDRVFLDNRFWYVSRQICGPDTTFSAEPHLYGLVPSCMQTTPFADFAGVCESDVGVLDACISISAHACPTLCNQTTRVDFPSLMPTRVHYDEYAPDPYVSIPIESTTLSLNGTLFFLMRVTAGNILSIISTLSIVSLSEQPVLVAPGNITFSASNNTYVGVLEIIVRVVSINRPSFVVDSLDFQTVPSDDAWVIIDVSKFDCNLNIASNVTLQVKST